MGARHIAAAACIAALAGGCVIREIHEIRTVPGESTRSPSCPSATSSVPGSVLADSQPPAPMVEVAGEPPGQGYVWVDGYWHWDGAEWIWIGGRWVPEMADFMFVPPAYYASGTACVYVPGYWQRGPRDHRPISIGGHAHRPHGTPQRPHHIGDHRGDKPTGKTGSLAGVGGDQDEVVVTVPGRPRPVPTSPAAPRPGTPTWRAPASPPPSAPARPSPPPAQTRPAPPQSPARPAPTRPAPPPVSAPRPLPSPGPARVAPPPASPPARTAPAPAPSKPAAPPPRPAPPAGPAGKKK